MLLYHTTYNADAILGKGFKHGTGCYMTDRLWSGVWLSDRPLDANEGAKGDTVLVVEMPEDEVVFYEWVEEGKPVREFLVPAEVVNRYSPFEVVADPCEIHDDRFDVKND
jgi:hypothetical protein